MVEVNASGTLSTSGSEQFVGLKTYNGVNVLTLDMSAAVDGDIFVVRAYRSVTPSGSFLILDETVVGYADIGNEPIWQTIPYSMPYGCRFGIQQVSGSARSIPWEVVSVGQAFVEQQGGVNVVVGVDNTLVVSTSGKLCVVVLDLSAVIEGKMLRVRSRREVLNAGTRRVYMEDMFKGPQLALNGSAFVAQSVPYLATYGGEFILSAYGGSISLDYSIESFDE